MNESNPTPAPSNQEDGTFNLLIGPILLEADRQPFVQFVFRNEVYKLNPYLAVKIATELMASANMAVTQSRLVAYLISKHYSERQIKELLIHMTRELNNNAEDNSKSDTLVDTPV